MSQTMRPFKKKWLRLTRFGDATRSEFLANLAGLVDSGIPVYDALGAMERVYAGQKDPRSAILKDFMRRLHDGKTIADAMRPWLAPHETQMLSAISRGVELGAALRNAAYLTESRKRIVGAVTGSMAYPIVLLLVGAGMMLVFAIQVIPTLASLIPVEKWSGLGLFYHGISFLVRNHGLLMLLAILAAVGASLWSLPRWRPGRARLWLDQHIPPWSLYQVYQGAILLVTLSIMMRSAIAMGDAVKILWDNTPSLWLRSHLNVIRRQLEQGEGVRLAALDNPIFPIDVRIAVALLDRQGEPDKAMARLGVQAVESAEKSAKRIGATANALVLLLVGVLIGGVIPAVMTVIMSFYTQITTAMRM